LGKNPSVRLMYDKLGDVPHFHAEFLENLSDRLFKPFHRQAEQRRALHPQRMAAGFERLLA